MIDPDVDPAGIGGQILDPVGDGVGDIGAGSKEAVVLHLDRVAFRSPLPARVGQPAQLLLPLSYRR